MCRRLVDRVESELTDVAIGRSALARGVRCPEAWDEAPV